MSFGPIQGCSREHQSCMRTYWRWELFLFELSISNLQFALSLTPWPTFSLSTVFLPSLSLSLSLFYSSFLCSPVTTHKCISGWFCSCGLWPHFYFLNQFKCSPFFTFRSSFVFSFLCPFHRVTGSYNGDEYECIFKLPACEHQSSDLFCCVYLSFFNVL